MDRSGDEEPVAPLEGAHAATDDADEEGGDERDKRDADWEPESGEGEDRREYKVGPRVGSRVWAGSSTGGRQCFGCLGKAVSQRVGTVRACKHGRCGLKLS